MRQGNIDQSKSFEIVQPLSALYTHRNQQLFSDYYLNVILPKEDGWIQLAKDAQQVLYTLRNIFRKYTPSKIEAQLEDELVKPIFKELGYILEVQPSLKTPDGTKSPDYIFYRDQAMKDVNKGKLLDEKLLRYRAFAVGDAKYWDRPLDFPDKNKNGDAFTNKNPSYQISFYMQYSGLDWGILTNGRLWRLYHKDTAHKFDHYYEVNLPKLLEENDINNFLYFYAFFRRQAFEPGRFSLESFRRNSINLAQGVGDSLKEQVYEALLHIAQGFLDYPSNKLQIEDTTLKTIYDNSLIVLYRLLFILYAEARELLPVQENRDYRESYSLEHIKEQIKEDLDAQRSLLPNTATIWSQLKALFNIINEGSPPLRVATFNGGLFDPQRHLFLENYVAGDQHWTEPLRPDHLQSQHGML